MRRLARIPEIGRVARHRKRAPPAYREPHLDLGKVRADPALLDVGPQVRHQISTVCFEVSVYPQRSQTRSCIIMFPIRALVSDLIMLSRSTIFHLLQRCQNQQEHDNGLISALIARKILTPGEVTSLVGEAEEFLAGLSPQLMTPNARDYARRVLQAMGQVFSQPHD